MDSPQTHEADPKNLVSDSNGTNSGSSSSESFENIHAQKLLDVFRHGDQSFRIRRGATPYIQRTISECPPIQPSVITLKRSKSDGSFIDVPLKTAFRSSGSPVKNVRFADSIGNHLALIRHIPARSDSPPTPPELDIVSTTVSKIRRFKVTVTPSEIDNETELILTEASIPKDDCNFFDMTSGEFRSLDNMPIQVGSKRLKKMFVPYKDQEFATLLIRNEICLDYATTTRDGKAVGIVWVLDIVPNKTIVVRFTKDGWKTYQDQELPLYEGSISLAPIRSVGPSNPYWLSIDCQDLKPGQELSFAICFKNPQKSLDPNLEGNWDNHYELNYTFKCYGITSTNQSNNENKENLVM